ncbi:hypothetical protein L7F22_001914 [Adiantum nelumboides]|nr:hypothetical protein [Adiantum nelumboides]
MEEWKAEKRNLYERISLVEEQAASREATIRTFQGELLAAKNGQFEKGKIQPSMIEELNTMREEIRVIKEDEEKKSWAADISKKQKKVEEAKKWIKVAKKGKGKEAPCTPTLINMPWKGTREEDAGSTCEGNRSQGHKQCGKRGHKPHIHDEQEE